MDDHRAQTVQQTRAPFDHEKLDSLMEEAGLDALVVTSKHNVQYLLGGYRFFFFDYMDAIGVSRYLPVFAYPKGRPDEAAYFGNRLESYEKQLDKFWTPVTETVTWGTTDAIGRASDYLRKLGCPLRTVGIEMGFLPADAHATMRQRLANCELTEALRVLELLRARKTSAELALVRQASERVIESMLAVISGHGPGVTKKELADALRREEQKRGLTFEYCLVTAGASHNRSPSDQRVEKGDVLSLDSGGNYKGYIGDLCRMGIMGEPDGELEDLLAEIDSIQLAARTPIKAGVRGGDIYAAAEEVLAKSPHRKIMAFTAHGMGLITHEAPRLTGEGPVPYPADDADRPLEAGMVVSIETTLPHPTRGYIKLEDTVAVTDAGYEGFGDQGRGWNRGKA
ncbi:MAG: M24 family metallopeptidase [Hyphomicrobiales bacterium]